MNIYIMLFANIVKKYCILRDLRPLSRRHSNKGRTCFKEILFTRALLYIPYILN